MSTTYSVALSPSVITPLSSESLNYQIQITSLQTNNLDQFLKDIMKLIPPISDVLQNFVSYLLKILTDISSLLGKLPNSEVLNDPKVQEIFLKRLLQVKSYGINIIEIDVDNEGEPAFYVSYEDWLRYVKESDLQAFVIPTRGNLNIENVLKDLGIYDYKLERNDRGLIVHLTNCNEVDRVEYVAFILPIANGKYSPQDRIIPTCKAPPDYERHFLTQLKLGVRYTQGVLYVH
ncbi:hypothetical protein V6M85_08280 [Sulfolobus tengchongensis]|uniref:Uncharacterized protein n=1 Tax=Sulfolobus tengchongensis TaxID=207809 RepID=A0AAX4KX76_9CREN